MLDIAKLREFGADVDEALVRCMNKEDFYLMLVNKAIADDRLTTLEEQINENDLASAFETAHTLKGMYTNLALTPLSSPIIEITEFLRLNKDMDYSAYLTETKLQLEKLRAL